MKYLLILLFIFSFNGLAEIRYVSKTGSSTIPYTSWATACDSIQKCINICSSGDTIYVANGVYKERIVLINGLTLLGSGRDSCIIDVSTLSSNKSKSTIRIKNQSIFELNNKYLDKEELTVLIFKNDCIVSGFCIIGGNTDSGMSWDFTNTFRQARVENNRFLNCETAIDFQDKTIIEERKTIIRNNEIFGITGVLLTNSRLTFESNYFYGTAFNSEAVFTGLNNASIIRNNLLIHDHGDGRIIDCGFSLSNKFYNNICVGVYKRPYASAVFLDGDNVFKNNFVYGGKVGIFSDWGDTIVNNIVVGSYAQGINDPIVPAKYNAVWDSPIGSVDTTNKIIFPMLVDLKTDQHLQKYSPLIDAGDPAILDVDGTRSDIGPYGGPFGESYDYRDLSPDIPKGLTAKGDTLGVRIKWKKNYEADFKQFLLYRDTVANFIPSESNLAGTFTDTTYAHGVPYYPIKYYYRIKSEDNQGNISPASEQIAIKLTDIYEENPQVIQEYILYQNYPNPFNPNTIISYRLKEQGYVKLYVYDMKGELVSTLVNEVQPAGYYEREFSGKAATDISDLASGVYIYRIEVIGNNNILVFSEMKKMILLK